MPKPRLFARHPPYQTAEAFSALFEKTHVIVFRYLYGWTGGNRDDAEDFTAETYLRAWRARGRFTGNDEAALGWLLQIARRVAIDQYRRRSVRPVEAALEDEGLPIGATEHNPETHVIAEEKTRTLLTLLAQLPDDHREMVVLRYLLGWRVNQIGAHLGIAENTVSVTLKRALARMQANWPETQAIFEE